MKCQDLFSLKNKKKIFECRLLQILLGALRVNSLPYILVLKFENLKKSVLLPVDVPKIVLDERQTV